MTFTDSYNRTVDYLRISINRGCTHRCIYCDKEGYLSHESDQVLSAQDVGAIVRVFNETGGIRKVKITGGEPLLHPDVVGVVKAISSIPMIEDVSMTTNGYLLPGMAAALKAAGLDRLNISLCSIDKKRYKKVTGVDGLARVLEGIDEAIVAGLVPVKINFVLMKGINDTELDSLLEYCGKKGLRLQLIELHEIEAIHAERRAFFEAHHLDVEAAVQAIKTPVDHVEYRNLQHRKLVFFTNGASIEIIKVTPEFCANCTKLRITAEGKIKPCLMKSGSNFDLLTMLHEGRSMADIKALISDAVQERKPFMTGGSGKGCH